MWVLVLQAAEEWGVPPWVVERDAPAIWWERWAVWKEERARLAKKGEGRGARKKNCQWAMVNGQWSMGELLIVDC